MKIPKYPDDFFDFSNGVDISNSRINEWIQKCINDLEKDLSIPYSSISCGNTQVIVTRALVGKNDYEISVSKGYMRAEAYPY